MSIPVPLPELAGTMSRFGSVPYLLTVGPDATPHAASVTVEWAPPEAPDHPEAPLKVPDHVGNLLVGAGRRTAANVRANEALALLWPPPSPGDYSLIVDGTGSIREEGPHLVVVIKPRSAVLHVTARRP
ncbi:MAG TPA: hypothetical protein VG779_03525 [Actinomycetota bacterium]|jgi:hypothetical protein|nr:hypothetical protein [Actinomycetota bacterium]